MCRRMQCGTCDRPTFAGCGNHVEQVLGDVAPADRCPGHHVPSAGAGRTGKRSWRERLTGRPS